MKKRNKIIWISLGMLTLALLVYMPFHFQKEKENYYERLEVFCLEYTLWEMNESSFSSLENKALQLYMQVFEGLYNLYSDEGQAGIFVECCSYLNLSCEYVLIQNPLNNSILEHASKVWINRTHYRLVDFTTKPELSLDIFNRTYEEVLKNE